MEAGARQGKASIDIDLCPLADGGEGTVAALVAATGGKIFTRRVTGPLPEMKVEATFGLLGDGQTAVVEMSSASGLALLKAEDRNPLNTTTFGTGELLVAAAETGARHIILGIGGSATTDGGIGCAQACGLPVILEGGEPVAPTEPLCGRDIDSVVLIKHARGGPLDRVKITVACDVTNPLFGPNGAARIFGPQKGASPQDVATLDTSLQHLAERLGKLSEANTPGAGAAGGLGFGMLAYFGATLRSGIDIVLDATQFDERLRGVDLVLTGEGRMDAQTLDGKVVAGVALRCKAAGVRCVALIGGVGEGAEKLFDHGLTSYFAIVDRPMSLDEAMRDAPSLLEQAARNVIRTLESSA
jgi:glycerate kinase